MTRPRRSVNKPNRSRQLDRPAAQRRRRLTVEQLEERAMLAAEFGFGSRLAGTNTPLLPILVKYIDTEFAIDTESARGQTPAYYNQLLFGPDYPNATDYLHEMSGESFQFTRAGQGAIGPFTFKDDWETPVLRENEHNTTNVIAGGGAILFASLRIDGSNNFVIATGGGGEGVLANSAGPALGSHRGNYEIFKIIDLTGGGTLRYGDQVRLKTLHETYLSSSGSLLNAVPSTPAATELFFLEHPNDPTSDSELVYQDAAPNDSDNDDNANKLFVRIRTAASTYLQVNAWNHIGFTSDRAASTIFELEATVRSDASFHRSIIQLASAEINFAEFDRDKDGVVNTSPQDTNEDKKFDKGPELAILSITARPTQSGGGSVRWYDKVTVETGDSRTMLAGDAADLAMAASVTTAAHELTHLLGTADLYGKGSLSWFMTLMSSTVSLDDDLATRDLIEGFTYHLDPWHKMQLGWLAPTVFDISDPNVAVDDFSLSDAPVILYDSTRGEGEYYILERRPNAGVYDADVTTKDIPVPGVAVWYVQTNGDPVYPTLVDMNSLTESGSDRSVFALSHFGTHIGDPMVPISRGARETVFHQKLWRGGDYRLRWANGADIGVNVNIHSIANDWRLRVERGSSPALGGAITQSALGSDEFDDQFGQAVVTADFNGDGYPDLAVGAPGESIGSDPKSGTVFVFHGSSQGLQPAYSLTQAGVGVNEAGDLFGTALAAGNFNGDVNPVTGLPLFDLAVGAPGEAPGSNPRAGAVFIYRGTPQGLVTAPSLTQAGLDPDEDGDLFGTALAFGDFDGDGADDLAIGAPGESTVAGGGAGRVYIFRGVQGTAGRLEPGYAVDLAKFPDDRFGAALAAADFTGDGFVDLVVGAPNRQSSKDDPTRSGAAFFLQGGQDRLSLKQEMFQDRNGDQHGDLFAAALAAGDFDLDGIADLAVGVPGKNSGRGQVAIYSGSDSDLKPRYELDGSASGDRFGAALAARDFTGDLASDLAVGAPGKELWGGYKTGGVYLFRASSDLNGPLLQQERVLTKFGLDSFWKDSGEQSAFGTALAIADFNRDGFGDVAVGAPGDYNLQGFDFLTPTGTVFFYAGVGDSLPLDTIRGTPNNDTWYVRTDPSGAFLQIWAADAPSDTPHYSVPKQQFSGSGLTIDGLDGKDRLILDFANGNPALWKLTFEGGTGTEDVVEIRGSTDSDDVTVTDVHIEANGITLPYNNVEIIDIDTKAGNDSISIDGTAAGTRVILKGGADADTYYVGGGDYIRNVSGDVVVEDEGGDDTLIIEDAQAVTGIGLGVLVEDEYTIGPNRFVKTSTVTSVFGGSVTEQRVLSFDAMAEIAVHGSRSNGSELPDRPGAIYNVIGVNVGTSLTILGNSGTDRFVVGHGDYNSRIRGPVTINGGSGDDELLVDDRNDAETDHYILSDDSFTKPSLGVSNVPTLTYASISQITIDGSDADSTFDILEVRTGVTVIVNGHRGAGTFNVGQRDFDTNISGKVIVRGGSQSDTLKVDDQGDILEDDYTITSNTFTKSSTTGRVEFSSIQEFKFDANNRDNTIEVLGTLAALTINSHGGDDTIVFSPLDMNLDSIQALVSIDGGAGNDAVVLHDRNFTMSGQPGTLPYFIRPNLVQKIYFSDPVVPFGKFPGLLYTEIEDLTLRAADGDNAIIVDGTSPATQLGLFGNDGNDSFVLQSPPSGTVAIFGGPPSTAPGDSLRIVGAPDSVAVYEPGSTSNFGAVDVDGHRVTFTGLEPVLLENFAKVTLVTPRSYDTVVVTPESDGWTKIAGTSGGIRSITKTLEVLPFESLSFRDVAHVVLDTAAQDNLSYQLGGDYYAPLPNDQITIHPGALAARGLLSFSVVTGSGRNVVHDSTQQGAPAPTLKVYGLGGFTQAFIYGASARLDVEQFFGMQAELSTFDAAGLALRRVELSAVGQAILPQPWNHIRAIGEDVNRTFSISGTSQVIAGEGLIPITVKPAVEDSRLDIVALGDSRIELRGILFAESRISGLRAAGPQPEPPASPDHIVVAFIDEFASTSQQEPPRLLVEGYGAEDSFHIEGAKLADGTPQPTGFALDFESLNLWDIELLVRPTSPLAQLGFTVLANAAGEGPALGFIGNGLAGDTASVSMPTNDLARVDPGQLIELLVEGIRTILTRGADLDEHVALETRADGGLASSVRQVDGDGFNKIELLVITDPTAEEYTFEGSGGVDEFDIRYPEPDFRPLTAQLLSVETVSVKPDPAAILIGLLQPVRQTLTPSTGEVRRGNLLLMHDDALTNSFVEASSVDLLVTRDATRDSFSRDLLLGYRYLGSEGKYVVEDVTFEGTFDLAIEHKDGKTNTTTIQERDVAYQKSATIQIIGAEGGQDQVLVTKAGVETDLGSKLEVALKTGDDLIVVTTTDSGSAATTKDEILVTGTAEDGTTEEVKAILVHKQMDATPEDQLDDLMLEKPEYQLQIEALKAKADQPLLAERGTPKPDAGETLVAYEGEGTKLDLFVKNVSPKVLNASVMNQNGTTTIEKVGSVTVSVPELAGTGIDPTQPFSTFVVVNTLDAGQGSLRAAIEAANAWTGDGLAVVAFAIPATDPHYVDVDDHLPGGDPQPDAFVISPLTALPAVARESVVINGQSQHRQTGDSNPFGPEIVLSGALASGIDALDGLVSNYRLNGTVDDFAGENQPSATAGISFVDGKVGQGVSFEPGGYIDIPHSDNLANQAFTLAAWVRPDGPGPNDDEFGSVIIAKGIANTNTSVTLNWSAQSQRFVLGSGNVYNELNRTFSASSFEPGQYYHVAATFDGTTFRLYVDGILQGSHVRNSAIEYEPTIPWTIGSTAGIFRVRPGQPNFPRTWNGVIDEIGIYNRALDITEVQSLTAPVQGLRLASSHNHVHGFNIQQFSGDGILVTGNENTLTGNYIGTTATGDAVAGNGEAGVRIVDSSNNLIGGVTPSASNIISANGTGVLIGGTLATGNHIAGNYIGLGADGTTALGNSADGIRVGSGAGVSGNVIGGSEEGLRNVISANGSNNIVLAAAGTIVRGNYIGTDWTGSAIPVGLGIGRVGIRLSDDVGSVIGGLEPGAGNVIAGHSWGVYLSGGYLESGAQDTRIQGNVIGLQATGNGALANLWGVYLDGYVDSDGVTREVTNVLIGGSVENAGNVISGNQIEGIRVYGPGTRGIEIQGNRIGTDRNGETAFPSGTGVALNDTSGVAFRRNLVSGNTGAGVSISGGGNHLLQGNLIGLAAVAGSPLGNGAGIVVVNSAGNVIGGDDEPDRNVISASTVGYGIAIQGVGSTGNLVEGNYIGTDVTGTLDRGNASSGVLLQDATGNTLRGNVISGNGVNGVFLVGSSPMTNVTNDIEANYIGTDASGTRDLGNALMGIRVQRGEGAIIRGNVISGNDNSNVLIDPGAGGVLVAGNLIGTNFSGNSALLDPQGLPAAGVTIVGSNNTLRSNVIAGNPRHGLILDGQGATDGRGSGNILYSNLIGVGLDGTTPLPNMGNGVRVWRGARDNTIGTNGDGDHDDFEGNTIAYNAAAGVTVIDNGSTANTIRGNWIFSNGGLGIDLRGEGVTPNDKGDLEAGILPDTDLGPNGLQNFPEISSVQPGVQTRVTGILRSTPGASFAIDFYASTTADPTQHGEGERWLGSTLGVVPVVADSDGVARFNVALPAATFGGQWITATATLLTDAGNGTTRPTDTSEFSLAYLIKPSKGERGQNSFMLEISASEAAGSSTLAAAMAVELIGVAGADLGGTQIDVGSFTTAILYDPRGPVGLPMQLAAYSSAVSPRLLEAAAHGLPLGGVELIGHTTIDGIPFEFARWSFEGARIASFMTTSSDQDQFVLVYDRLRYSYTPLTQTGAPGAPVVGVWDVTKTGGMVLPALPDSAPLTPRTATIDYFVNIPGIEGDSQRAGYVGWLEASSFEFALGGPDPQGAKHALATTFDVIAEVGRASPRLLSAVASGDVFSSPIEVAVVGHVKSGSVELARWTLEGASIAAYATASGLLEGFSIAFDTLHYGYSDFQSDGEPLPHVGASWNLVDDGAVMVTGDVDLDAAEASSTSTQIFARIPGAEGDSSTVGYAGWIPVDEFGFRMERPLPAGGAPHGTSFAFAAPTGKSSPMLFQLAANGTLLTESVQIALVHSTKQGPQEFARWTLNRSGLGSFATSGAMLDSFTVGFDELTYAYTPRGALGQALPPVVGNWDASATGSRLAYAPLELSTSQVAKEVSLLVTIPGIQGASTLAGYTDWLPVQTFDFELFGPLAGANGVAVVSAFHFHATASEASPELLRAIASGQQFPAAEVVAVRTVGGSTLHEFARWSLSNVQVVAYATENVLADSFALSFDALNYAFTPAETKTKAPPVTASWNRIAADARMVPAAPNMPESIVPPDVRMLVQVPGIQGSSQLVGYVDWMEVDSARLAADRLIGSDLSFVSTFQLVARSSPGSAQLLQAVAEGRVFTGTETVQLVTVRIPKEGAPQELARWTLRDAAVTSFSTASAWQDGFSLGFRELQLDYTSFSAKGLPEATVQVPWHMAATGTQLVDQGPPALDKAAPSNDVLLRIPGIEGDSQRSGYVGWIPLEAFRFTLSRPWDSGQDASASALTLTLFGGLASPRLLEGVAHGVEIPSVELVAIAGSLNTELARLELGGVTLVGFQTDHLMFDGLALTFESLVFQYRQFDATGSPAPFIVGTWSVTESNSSDPQPVSFVESAVAVENDTGVTGGSVLPSLEPASDMSTHALYVVEFAPRKIIQRPGTGKQDTHRLDQFMAELATKSDRDWMLPQGARFFADLGILVDDPILDLAYAPRQSMLDDALTGDLLDLDVVAIPD